MTHICVSKLTIIGSDNGLSPDRRQAIIWTNDGLLLIGSLGTNFSEISIEILTFSLKKMRLKMSSAKWRPFCPGLNVLRVKFWFTDVFEMMHKAWSSIKEMPYCFSRSLSNFKVTRLKNCRLWPKLGVVGLWLQFECTDDYEMMHKAWSIA